MTARIRLVIAGSCTPNPGRGGWAVVHPLSGEVVGAGAASRTTNNRMELAALMAALARVDGMPVEIIADATYVTECAPLLLSGWKDRDYANVKNPDLWKEIDALLTKASSAPTWRSPQDREERRFMAKAERRARHEAQSVKKNPKPKRPVVAVVTREVKPAPKSIRRQPR